MVHEIIQENAEEIAKTYKEAQDFFDGKQMSLSYDVAFRRYAEKIGELSGRYCLLNRFLSNTNIESGRYKMSLIFRDNEDKIEVEKYLGE